jgi:hypothetical protein
VQHESAAAVAPLSDRPRPLATSPAAQRPSATLPPLATDQKARGSSPSERAQVTGPTRSEEGSFSCCWEPYWEPPCPIHCRQCLTHGRCDGPPVPSTRCPYTSFVIVMLACLKISDTACSGVPWASISEAPECRSSCECQWPSPALLHSLAKVREKFSGSSGARSRWRRSIRGPARRDRPPSCIQLAGCDAGAA